MSSEDSANRTPHAGVSRLAPSPTGALHLGNLRTFILNWLLARQRGWRILMRIEDLDGPRIKEGAEADIFETFGWFGIDWDGEVVRQSDDLQPYISAIRALAEHRQAYPCRLTRKEIAEAASAPHGPESESIFPIDLRPDPSHWPGEFTDEATNWRVVVSDSPIEFDDEFCGQQQLSLAASIGDFVVWTKRGTPSYQLAVVVDDNRQGVTHVVRGDDLLDSAARQLLLYRNLGLAAEPAYLHLPLVIGPDGRRLAKRHGDTRVRRYRDEGVAPERLLGLIAYWSGTLPDRQAISLEEFLSVFDLSTVPREPVTFSAEDEKWLCSE